MTPPTPAPTALKYGLNYHHETLDHITSVDVLTDHATTSVQQHGDASQPDRNLTRITADTGAMPNAQGPTTQLCRQHCMRMATTLSAITLDTGASILETTGEILAILGGATAALRDATSDTAAEPATNGAFSYNLTLTYDEPLPGNNTPSEPEPVTLCNNHMEGDFPIDSIGGLAITRGGLGFSIGTTLCGLGLEYLGHRLRYATNNYTAAHLAQNALKQYLATSQAPANSHIDQTSISAAVQNAQKGLTDSFRHLGQLADPTGKILVMAGLGFWVLQQGLGATPYAGLNGLTLTERYEQPINIPISTQTCSNTNFPDPTAYISGMAEGYILFPEVFTQNLSATPIIFNLLVSGIASLLFGKVAHHLTQQIRVPQTVRDSLGELPRPVNSSIRAQWFDERREIVNKVMASLTRQGLVRRLQVPSVSAALLNTLESQCHPPPKTALHDIELGRSRPSVPHLHINALLRPDRTLDQLASFRQLSQPQTENAATVKERPNRKVSLSTCHKFAKDLFYPFGPLPIHTKNTPLQTLLFLADLGSKIGTVAIMASYISRTVSDGIPYLSRGFDGVPAGAESTFPLNTDRDIGEYVHLMIRGAVTIPQFSLQNFHTNWFLPLILFGGTIKIVNSLLQHTVRQRQCQSTLGTLAEKWRQRPPENVRRLVIDNTELTLNLLEQGIIDDNAVEGFLVSATACPPLVRCLGVTPYETLSLARLQEHSQRTSALPTTNCLRKTWQKSYPAIRQVGLSANEMAHGVFTVLASYAIGIALISQIFESWSTHGKIAAEDMAGTDLNFRGFLSTQNPTIVHVLHNISLYNASIYDMALDCNLLPTPFCKTPFTLSSGFLGAPLAEYDIPNPSLVTDHMRTMGLAIGIPALALAIWWGRKLGSLGTEKNYNQLDQTQTQ